MRLALIVAVGWVWLTGALARGQQPAPCVAGARPTFDVATVKADSGLAGHSSMHPTADGTAATGTVRRLVLYAYGLRDFQVNGGPDWVNTATWDVRATVDPPETDPMKLDQAGMKAWAERYRERMQVLLADRFKLRCHIATKELPVYDLVVAKGGSKLQPTAADNPRHSMSINSNGRKTDAKASGVETGEIATMLAGEVGRSVVDKTRLAGRYDFAMTWAPDAESGEPNPMSSGATIFTAVQEQLGLKLEPAKGPVDVLVIDAVEKPGEN